MTINVKYLIILLLASLTLCSCINEPLDTSYQEGYYNPNNSVSESFFQPLTDGNDVANIYGMANNYDNISVIASGQTFEISCLPQDIFLAPFPGGSIDAGTDNIGMLRDVIPYTHSEFCNPESTNQPTSYQLAFPKHSMRYRVAQEDGVHDVCITFGATTGTTELRIINGHYYWVYMFRMEMTDMTVDGKEHPLPASHTIEYRLYYSRLRDSIA